MSLIRKAMDAITRCYACQGTGLVPKYIEAADVIDRSGRVVASTPCAPMKKCPTCGGTGRSRPAGGTDQ